MLASSDGGARFLVRAVGFVPMRGVIDRAESDQVVSLDQAASLTCRVTNEVGAPLSGLRVGIVRAGEEPSVDLRSAGVWSWPDLLSPSHLAFALCREDPSHWRAALQAIGYSFPASIEGAKLPERLAEAIIGRLRVADAYSGVASDRPLTIGVASSEELHTNLRPLLGELIKVTDQDGRVSWHEMPPGDYRVGVAVERWRDPMYERCRAGAMLDIGDLGSVVKARPGVAETLHLIVPRKPGGRVFGRIPEMAPLRQRARLSRWVKRLDAVGNECFGYEEQAVCWLRDGGFEFVGIEPGEMIVRVCWEGADRSLYFAAARGVLEGEGELDLGLLMPLAGPIVDVAIDVLGANDEIRREVPSSLMATTVVLHIDAAGDARKGGSDLEHGSLIADSVDVRPGDRFRVVGLPRGDLTIYPTWQDGSVSRGCRLGDPFSGLLDRDMKVRIPIFVAEQVDFRLACVWPSGLSPRPLRVLAVSGDRVVAKTVVPAEGGGLALPEDVDAIWVDSNCGQSHTDGGAYCYVRGLRQGRGVDGRHVPLQMESAVGIRGIIEPGSSSAALPRRVWWRSPTVPGLTFLAEVSAEGAFYMEGLPPGQTLLGMRGLPALDCGTTGVSDVRVRMTR